MTIPVKRRTVKLSFVELEEEFVAWDIAYAVDGISYYASIFSPDLQLAWESLSLMRGWDLDYNGILTLANKNGYWFADLNMKNVFNAKTTEEPKFVHVTLGNIPAKSKEEAILHIMDIMDWGILTGGFIQLKA